MGSGNVVVAGGLYLWAFGLGIIVPNQPLEISAPSAPPLRRSRYRNLVIRSTQFPEFRASFMGRPFLTLEAAKYLVNSGPCWNSLFFNPSRENPLVSNISQCKRLKGKRHAFRDSGL